MRLGLNICRLELVDPDALERSIKIFRIRHDGTDPLGSAALLDVARRVCGCMGVAYLSSDEALMAFEGERSGARVARELRLASDGDDGWSAREVSPSWLVKGDQRSLLRVLLSSLPGKILGASEAENLMGSLYWRMPAYDVVTGSLVDELSFLRVDIGEDMSFRLSVKTFTRTTLKDQIRFERKPFEAYPLYRFNGVALHRCPSGTVADDVFIQRVRAWGRPEDRNIIDFYTYVESGARGGDVGNTKLGAFDRIMGLLEATYDGAVKLELETRDYDDGLYEAKDFSRRKAWDMSAALPKVSIKDTVGTHSSMEGACLLAHWLKGHGVTIGRGGVVLNFIREAQWYSNRKLPDAYIPATPDMVVQNCVWSRLASFRGSCKRKLEKGEPLAAVSHPAMESVLKEALIKWGCKIGWTDLAQVPEPITFLAPVAEDDCLGELTVEPSGSLSYREYPILKIEDGELSSLFLEDPPVCAMVFQDGSVNLIRETGLFTVPEKLHEHIERVRRDETPRGRIAKDVEASSLLGIGVVRVSDDSALFYAGQGKNVGKSSLKRSSNIRSLEALPDSELRLDLMPPLLEVDFVRLRQLTVVPWPLKFLREFHAMAHPAYQKVGAENNSE